MSVVLKLDTTASLFDPIEVEIDGRVLKVKRITLGDLERIQALQAEAAAGSAKAIRESLETLLVGDVSVVKEMPLDILANLISTIVEQSFKPTGESKNSQGSGDQSLPS